MSDYIKKEDAIIEIERFGGYLDDDMLYRIKLALGRLPSADVVKVRHAKWQLIHRDRNFYKDVYQCSECRFLVTGAQEIAYDYCPYCGARMDGGNDE